MLTYPLKAMFESFSKGGDGTTEWVPHGSATRGYSAGRGWRVAARSERLMRLSYRALPMMAP